MCSDSDVLDGCAELCRGLYSVSFSICVVDGITVRWRLGIGVSCVDVMATCRFEAVIVTGSEIFDVYGGGWAVLTMLVLSTALIV